MSTTHTPSPWHIKENSNHGPFSKEWRSIYSGNNPVVEAASFTRTSQGESYDICGVRINEADAKLIAAAPEMRECIEELVELLSTLDFDSGAYKKALNLLIKTEGAK